MDKRTKITYVFLNAVLSLAVLGLFLFKVPEYYGSARLKTVNYFKPGSYEELFAVSRNGEKIDGVSLLEYATYFKKIARHIGDQAGARGLLGFCYMCSGDDVKAIEEYEKARRINPRFFWYYYNLGILYLKQGDKVKARREFSEALKLPPDGTLKSLYSSKVYRDVLGSIKEEGLDPGVNLRNGYFRAAFLLSVMDARAIPEGHLKGKIF